MLKLRVLIFLIVGFLLSYLKIPGKTFNFSMLPGIFMALYISRKEGAIVNGLVYFMTGIYALFPQSLVARIVIGIGAFLGTYIMGIEKAKIKFLSMGIVVASMISFGVVSYVYKSNGLVAGTILSNWIICGLIAFVMGHVVDMPNQKGVIAKWLKS